MDGRLLGLGWRPVVYTDQIGTVKEVSEMSTEMIPLTKGETRMLELVIIV